MTKEQYLSQALDKALDINNNLKEYIINIIINSNIYFIERYNINDLLNENSYPFNHIYKEIKELGIDIDRFKMAIQDKYNELKNKD